MTFFPRSPIFSRCFLSFLALSTPQSIAPPSFDQSIHPCLARGPSLSPPTSKHSQVVPHSSHPRYQSLLTEMVGPNPPNPRLSFHPENTIIAIDHRVRIFSPRCASQPASPASGFLGQPQQKKKERKKEVWTRVDA